MRIVVHGQQAFGKAVLEALIKRGEDVVAVYVAPEKPGAKADPLKEAALAAKLPVHQPDVLPEAGGVGGVPRAQARSAGDGLRHLVRAGGVSQHPDPRLDPVSPLALSRLSRAERDQLADHQGRNGNRPVDLLARQRARYRRRAAAEADADRARTTRSARSISTGCSRWASRRCWKRSTWSRPARRRASSRTRRRRRMKGAAVPTMPDRLGPALAEDRPAHPRLQSGAGRMVEARRQDGEDLRGEAAPGQGPEGHRRQDGRGRRSGERRLRRGLR